MLTRLFQITTQMKLKNQSTVFKMTLIGLSLALYVAFSFASFDLRVTKISMTGIPVIFISVVYGPLEGALVGGVGEFIYQLTHYGLELMTPLWLLPPLARGLVVGFMFKHKNPKQHPVLWIVTVAVSCLIVTTINTFSLWAVGWLFYEVDVKAILIAIVIRIATSIATAVVYAVLIPVLFVPLIKQGKFETEQTKEKGSN